jgi:hypothetical protein
VNKRAKKLEEVIKLAEENADIRKEKNEGIRRQTEQTLKALRKLRK